MRLFGHYSVHRVARKFTYPPERIVALRVQPPHVCPLSPLLNVYRCARHFHEVYSLETRRTFGSATPTKSTLSRKRITPIKETVSRVTLTGCIMSHLDELNILLTSSLQIATPTAEGKTQSLRKRMDTHSCVNDTWCCRSFFCQRSQRARSFAVVLQREQRKAKVLFLWLYISLLH